MCGAGKYTLGNSGLTPSNRFYHFRKPSAPRFAAHVASMLYLTTGDLCLYTSIKPLGDTVSERTGSRNDNGPCSDHSVLRLIFAQ